MKHSNLKISMDEYKRLVEEDSKKANSNSVYGKMLKNLSILTEMMQKYYTNDKDGKEPKLSPDDYKKLIEGYSKLAESCNDFLSENHRKDRLEKKRVNIIKKLSSYIGADLKGLLHADKTKESTLSEVIKESRIKTVDLTGKNLGRVGGALSNRIPLKSTSGIEGFFTKKSTFNYESARENIVNKLPSMLPEPFNTTFQDEDKAYEFLATFTMYPDINIYSENAETRETGYQNLANLLSILGPDMEKDDIYNMLKEDTEFARKFQQVHKEYNSIDAQYNINRTAGISNDCRLDQRNSAMSDVAALLGMSGIIAKSIPMKIIHEGEVIEGTFMEKAVGEDANNPTQDALLLQAEPDSFNHSTGLKQLADLQILDYICGNVDRHAYNIMYQFEKNADGKVVLTGISGIDNDASFGTELFQGKYDGKEITSLPNIKNMSMSCFETLQNISLDALKVVLADKLKIEEIEAVCKRVELLKEKMLCKDKENMINVVADDAWGKGDYTYDKLASRGIGTTIQKVVTGIEKLKEYRHELPESKTALNYTEGKDLTDDAELKFKEILSKVEDFVSQAKNVRGTLHRDSAEYKNMLKALQEVRNLGKSINNELEEKKDVKLDRFEKFNETVANLGLASQKYMDAKNVSQYTELGQKRFAFATEMRDFVQENISIKEQPAKENLEMSLGI